MPPRDALIVDDDPDSRDALAQILRAHGYAVRQAENGKIALDEIAERMPCVLVLDLEMPVMDGWQVLASLRRARGLEAMAVVVLSAGTSPPPGVAFIPKPCCVDDLLAMIARSGDAHAAGVPSPMGQP